MVRLVSQPFDLGVVDGQVPAVGVAQLVAAAAEQSLALGRHGLQGRQHRPAALRPAGLTGQVHGTAVVQIPDWTLGGKEYLWSVPVNADTTLLLFELSFLQ